MCIHQTDLEKKKRGIDGLGGFLKRSDKMLVLWDPTYFTRLWCTFELAAFLRLNDSAAQVLVWPITRPTMLLFVITALSVININREIFEIHGRQVPTKRACCVEIVLLIILCHSSRKNGRDVYHIHEQMETFSLKQAQCWCCSVNHVNPITGADVSCDREVVEFAIKHWYDGGLDEFAQWVREDMHANFEKSLTGIKLFRYRDILVIGITDVWLSLSHMGANCLDGDLWVAEVVQLLVRWLGRFPLSVSLWVWLTAFARKRLTGSNAFLDPAITVLVVVVFLPLNTGVHVVWNLAANWGSGIWGSILFGVFAAPILVALLTGMGLERLAHDNDPELDDLAQSDEGHDEGSFSELDDSAQSVDSDEEYAN